MIAHIENCALACDSVWYQPLVCFMVLGSKHPEGLVALSLLPLPVPCSKSGSACSNDDPSDPQQHRTHTYNFSRRVGRETFTWLCRFAHRSTPPAGHSAVAGNFDSCNCLVPPSSCHPRRYARNCPACRPWVRTRCSTHRARSTPLGPSSSRHLSFLRSRQRQCRGLGTHSNYLFERSQPGHRQQQTRRGCLSPATMCQGK
eukprot:COSAG01_NODE_1187_length_11337_cov_185.267574_3_plen_201_part_00